MRTRARSSSRSSTATRRRAARRSSPIPTRSQPDLQPLLDLILERIPAPTYEEGHPLQALVTNLDASPYVGRLALCRVLHGTIRRGQQVAWCRSDGTIERAKVTELYVTEALDRVEAEEAGPGEIIAVAGIPEVTIGETLADPDDPRPLPVITVDEPSLSMTIGINTSPLAGLDGDKVTASLVESRLRAELVGNVSLRVLPTERPDTWEVQGRGELQLAILVEQMRREGFELTVGKPQVVTRAHRRRRCTSRSSASRSTCPRSTSASSRSSSRSARAAPRRSSTTAPAGCAWTSSSRRAG